MIIYSKSPFGAFTRTQSVDLGDLRDRARNALKTVKECVSQLCSLECPWKVATKLRVAGETSSNHHESRNGKIFLFPCPFSYERLPDITRWNVAHEASKYWFQCQKSRDCSVK